MHKFWMSGFIIFSALMAKAEQVDYAAVADRSMKFLEKLVNVKPITGCETEILPAIEERMKELQLDYQIILSGDKPATPVPPVTDVAKKCISGKDPIIDGRPNIVVRLKATKNTKNLKAMLIVAHMDVVPAIGQKWSPGLDPHVMSVKDDYVYGRGVMDMLSSLAIYTELFGEIKKSGLPLERDLILMLNSDEERGGINGMGWLTLHQPELFNDIEVAISEGGSVVADEQQSPLFIGYEAAQKRYQDFKITATGPTGHSSVPTKVMAVNLMTDALVKLRQLQPLPRLIPLIRSYFKERAKVETDLKLKEVLSTLGNSPESESENLYTKYKKEVKALEEGYPAMHALIRRTCIPTVVNAGSDTAKNAQPQIATVYINCRLMPDETVPDLLAYFQKKINLKLGKLETDPNIKIEIDIDQTSGHAGASSITGLVPGILSKYAETYFKGIPVIPSMLTGATDLRYLRKMGIDAYGFAPLIVSDSNKRRSHGIDERLATVNLISGIEMFHNFMIDIVAPSSRVPASSLTYKKPISKNFKNAFGEVEADHIHGSGCQH